MVLNELILDAFARVQDQVHVAVKGLDADDLVFMPNGSANSIAWLIWHLTRIQDDHIADLAGQEQIWSKEWHQKFDLPFDEGETGYGHTAKEVAAVRASSELLSGYYDAVHAATAKYISTLKAEDYDRVVDVRWDPPVTVAVRLVSVISDDLQHVGQAAYVRGLRTK